MHRLAPLLALAACATDTRLVPRAEDPVPGETDTPDVRAPDVEVAVTELPFGTVAPGCPATRTVAVGNVGDAPLHVTHVDVEGEDQPAFVVADPGASVLRAGAWVDLQVTLAGDAPGDLAARLAVRSDDPDEPTVTVALTGAVEAAALHEQLAIQRQPAPVDLLWVVDYSGSMDTELEELGSHFPAFLRDFVDLGLDWRMAVTGAGKSCGEAYGPILDDSMATDDVLASFEDQTLGVLHAGTGCLQEQGFGGTSAFVATHPDFLRPDANFAVVVVADEEDQTFVPVRTFTTWLAGLKGGDPDRVTFSGMVGPAIGFPLCDACPLGSHPEADACVSPLYHLAIEQTGGAWGDLCTFDLDPFLRLLSRRAAGLWVRVPLDGPVADPDGVAVETLDGVAVPEDATDGWTYEAGKNAVAFHGAAIPVPGDGVVIRYPPAEACPAP